MTQEQKAKAYDEAFNRAKSWYTDAQIDFKKSLETLFPELKCDDEKIRKEIIKCVKNYGPSSANPQLFKNMLAWLEKQKTIDVLDKEEREFADNVDSYRKDMDEFYKKGYNAGREAEKQYWLEKQGEQPKEATYTHEVETGNGNIKALVTEKVQLPRFKVNDWVVSKLGNVWHIDSFDNKNYKVTDINGNHNCFPIYIQDRLHLYTHQDAKDGDVLASELCDSIILFRGIKDNNVDFYCDYDFSKTNIPGDRFSINDGQHYGDVEDSKDFHPATKEQRDTLLKAMTDAGWEFDFEKKELKKISQRMVSAEAKEALYDKPTDEEMKELLRTEYEKGRADVLRCIDPDEMVADFCSQPLSKTRSLASIYRQGIIDILKRIKNNEETSITGTRSINDCGM